MHDSELARDVHTEFAYEPSLNHSAIDATVAAGIATITGSVSSYPMYLIAERVALRVPGIRAVVNELNVEIPPESVRTDEDLAARAATVLDWTTNVPSEHIKVRVEEGRIHLHGEVESPHEREAAERAVEYLTGVRKVVNEIHVTAKRHANGTSDHLVAALRRSAISHACDIHVETRGDHVSLTGTVPSWADRDEVVRIAWAAPGVRHVDCHLRVIPPPRYKARAAGHS